MDNNRANSPLECHIKMWRPDGDDYEMLSASGITSSMPCQISQDYVIGVVEEGRASLSYRGKDYNVNGSCFLLLHPGEPFSRKGNTDYPRTVRMIIVSPELLHKQISSLMKRDTQLPRFRQPIHLNQDIIQSFLCIHRAMEMSSSRLERDNYLKKIVALLLENCILDGDESPLTRQESERVKRVRAFLLDNFNNKVSLEALASLVNLSPDRLNRVFSQEVGLPPHAFLNQVRVWHARVLLEKGIPISQVAIETGFYDQAHLNRHFKRLMGFTPGIIFRSNNQLKLH